MENFYGQAMRKALEGDLTGAVHDFDQALRLNPAHADALYNRGLLHGRLGDDQAACRDYTEAIRINPKKARAFLHRGLARSEQNDRCGAIADFERVLQLNPDNVEAQTALSRVRLELSNAQPDRCFERAHQFQPKPTPEKAPTAHTRPSLKRRKQYINVMERLVSLEYEAQTAGLSAQVLTLIDRTDVEAWALNRLPNHYATSRRWVEATAQQLLSIHQEQLTATVREGIVAVSRNWQPVAEALLPE